ncbi:regulatory factor X-associated protein [Maylandia zebra]|uniref:Regulatory factor X-associated protein n=3 Tax=Haplochromini TaxID=319058 RepID=A0A3B4G5B6_9CICH|nr:regulatory factor X-associated protein [Maylandia zebra]XP_005750801.1 PREDICTED: regulatory factor X-associated protein [Pundamilia nyererei]XP_005928153.1 regulatory factor X-associated protein [Haplochromis burtoni]XP_026039049.1 regulatory factor X-associated protein [Astatotilapia calliptera]
MSEEDASVSSSKDKDSTLLLTKDGHRYYVNKSGVVDSRNVITPHEPENNASYDMDDPDEESDVLDASDPRDGAASPEELNDEETSEGDNAPKQCTYDGCTETTTQVAKQRKPWMCKKHRNKMYKDKYKKKKNDKAMSSGKLDENSEERPVSVNKQRLGAMGDRPARPSLIEQVLNQKRLSLLRSPEVISFLQQQQQLLATQSRSQSQQQFQSC